jgi:two-component system NtrC family sensor kinase
MSETGKQTVKGIFIPLRFKVLVSLLLGITIVVGLITFTMANLFHTDKTTYINDLVSTTTVNTAQQTSSILQNYHQRVQTITRLAFNIGITQEDKSRILDDLFQDFPEMISITFYQDGVQQVSVFDELALESAGLTRTDLDNRRMENPITPAEVSSGKLLIRNATFDESLPLMTLAGTVTLPELETELFVEVMIRTDRLLSVILRSEVFEAFILEADGSFLVHKDPTKLLTRSVANWLPGEDVLPIESSLAKTFEYADNGVAMIGGFARVELGNLIVGAQIPKSTAYLSARSLFSSLIITSLIILLAAATISLFWSYRLTQPLATLTAAAEEIGKGGFEIKLTPSSRDEIGSLTESVNKMAYGLREREKALEQAQEALIQSEKMSAFGQLSAGIAHEVKNPLAGILGYTQLSLKKVEDGTAIYKNLKIIEQETRRCNSIIENLMKFARQDKLTLKPLNINHVIEDALTLVDHQMGINHVTVTRKLADNLPGVRGDNNQLIQVLMNIMINAQQAMDTTPGTVTVATDIPNAGVVELRIADTGPGMPEEVQQKIFEPFFTTKEVGKGTGLGLAVTYGIIKDHGGNIRVESEPGVGTTFIITLPVSKNPVPDEEEIPEPEEDTREPAAGLMPAEDLSGEAPGEGQGMEPSTSSGQGIDPSANSGQEIED